MISDTVGTWEIVLETTGYNGVHRAYVEGPGGVSVNALVDQKLSSFPLSWIDSCTGDAAGVRIPSHVTRRVWLLADEDAA